MVHALREIVRILTPSALLLDMRPVVGPAPIEIISDIRTMKVYEIDGSPGIPDDQASDEALDQIIQEGTLKQTHLRSFIFRHYWDTVEEMQSEIDTKWNTRNVIPPDEDLDHARKIQ